MASNVKKLGDFIVPIDLRNSDERFGEGELRGISVTKEFITSHANLVGVSFKGYKVVPSRSFAYIPDTSRRGDKIAIAYNGSKKTLIVSSICSVFGIEDESKLLPEYLMLWLSRSEFDRYARFKSHGSAREVFDWEQLCNVELPVPPIENQKRVLAIKQAIERRMASLAQLNDYLSELIEAIFVEWFVGANSRYPTKKVLMDEIAFVNAGGDKPDVWQKCQTEEFPIPIFSNGIDNEGLYGYTTTAKITKPSITVSARGTIGFTCLRHEPSYSIVRLVSATPRDYVTAEYLYLWVKRATVIGVGTTQQQLTVPMFKNYEVDVPDATSMEEFTRVTTPLFKMVDANKAENRKLSELRNALLPKLISGEVDISKVVI